jgi:hypothetical protein
MKFAIIALSLLLAGIVVVAAWRFENVYIITDRQLQNCESVGGCTLLLIPDRELEQMHKPRPLGRDQA